MQYWLLRSRLGDQSYRGSRRGLFATVLYLQCQSFAQIVKKMNKNNPDLAQIEIWAANDFPSLAGSIGNGFEVDAWKPPMIGKTFWEEQQMDWPQAVRAAQAWMEVRHCLSHGLASGWRSEV